jgi:hypothetical protein
MRLHCPSCGQPIVAEDVNVAQVVAKCRACHAVFRFEDQLGSAEEPPCAAPAPAAKVPLPEGITVERDESLVLAAGYRNIERHVGSLTITRRWYHARHLGMIPFCIGWNAFLVFWYTTVTSGNAPWIFFVFPLAHVAVGIGMTYSMLTGLFNKTRVTVNDGRLRVVHGPIPSRGNRDLPSSSVRQIYSEEHAKSGRNASLRYSVNAIVDDGPTLVLVKDLESSRQALYIEQELEAHLGIADEHVPGALSREHEALQNAG